MHFSYAVIVALLTCAVSSQNVADLVSQLPSCALLCLATSATAASCGLADYACQCGSARLAITNSATPCIISKCSADDAAKVLTVSAQICAAAGAVASPATSAGSAVTSAKAPVGSFVSSAGSAATSAKAPAASFVSSIAGSAGSAASSPTPSAASSTSSRPAQVSGNAGSKVQAGAAIAGLVVLAAFGL